MSGPGNGVSARYLTRVQLTNIRAFRELAFHPDDEHGAPRMRTLLIGRNGTCKSTLLRAITIGIADLPEAQALLASPIGGLIGASKPHGEIQLTHADLSGEWGRANPIRQILSDGRKEYLEAHDDWTGTPFLAAYGAGRYYTGGSEKSFRGYRTADAAAGLFNQARPLADPELTLRRLMDFQGSRFYEQTLLGIKRVLGLEPDDSIKLSLGGGIEVSGAAIGKNVSLDAWADGYRVTFSWLLDFYGWAMRAGAIDDDGVVRGILLIDEVDQHLHPSMQAQVMPRLAELLPEVQIIATTHSPLVALGAQPEELIALHRMPTGEVQIVSAPDFRLYSAEDMLTDDRLFATPPYSPEVNRKTERYHDLVELPAEARGPRETAELSYLARDLTRPNLPEEAGSAAFEEVQNILAKHGIR